MKSLLSLLIVMCLWTLHTSAQSKQEADLIQLVNEFNNAIINTDSTRLRAMTSKDLTYGHSSGLVQNQDAFIAGVVAGPNFFKKFDLTGQTVTFAGKNATVRHIATAQAVNQGNPVEIKFGNILVWQKKGSRWILIARQGYKL